MEGLNGKRKGRDMGLLKKGAGRDARRRVSGMMEEAQTGDLQGGRGLKEDREGGAGED